ncbi:hypothetical protein BLL52_1993 [Rhodoferax antarcticus ANT.BR]|uniref:Transposase n=1 Tax=Rhodoferax antarcticus ANT.BR TaxID=1111071 RepID=A0A1Q8YCL9_9BURK|nr:hypothetical protein BLL52_1993 [Rhodoferax antarcticus ANT.BR]
MIDASVTNFSADQRPAQRVAEAFVRWMQRWTALATKNIRFKPVALMLKALAAIFLIATNLL